MPDALQITLTQNEGHQPGYALMRIEGVERALLDETFTIRRADDDGSRPPPDWPGGPCKALASEWHPATHVLDLEVGPEITGPIPGGIAIIIRLPGLGNREGALRWPADLVLEVRKRNLRQGLVRKEIDQPVVGSSDGSRRGGSAPPVDPGRQQREAERQREADRQKEVERQREAEQKREAERQRETEQRREAEQQRERQLVEQRRQAEEAEQQRRQAVEAERQRRQAEEAEQQRRRTEEAERQRRQAEETERQRQQAEETERQRRLAQAKPPPVIPVPPAATTPPPPPVPRSSPAASEPKRSKAGLYAVGLCIAAALAVGIWLAMRQPTTSPDHTGTNGGTDTTTPQQPPPQQPPVQPPATGAGKCSTPLQDYNEAMNTRGEDAKSLLRCVVDGNDPTLASKAKETLKALELNSTPGPDKPQPNSSDSGSAK